MISHLFSLYAQRADFFLMALLQHVLISGAAICIAGVVGLLVGILISEFSRISSPILGAVSLLYTIPSISLLGFLIPVSGIGNTTAVIALTIYALLPMVRSTHTGLTNITPAIIEAARGMGSTHTQVLCKIKLPMALPVILSGVRNMVVMTIALAGIASFVGAGGLGVAIYRGITTNNALLTVAGSLLIALLALVMDLCVGLAEGTVRRRRRLTK